MVTIETSSIKAKNTMRMLMVYGASGFVASVVYWSIGYLLFAGVY